MRAHHERSRQRASFNAWVCALTSHASFFQFQFQYLLANSPALVQWRFVCMCVFVCLCVCQRFPRVFYSLPHPQHSGLCGQTMPTTNLTPCLFHHNSFIFVFSLSPTLSLYRLFGWSNVQVTFDNYYWNMFWINIIIMLMWGLNLVLSNGWLLVGFIF